MRSNSNPRCLPTRKYLHVNVLGRFLKKSRKPEDHLIIMPSYQYYHAHTDCPILSMNPWSSKHVFTVLFQITFMKSDTRELCGPINIAYHWTADFIPWELFSFDRRAVCDESYGFLFHSFAKQSVQNVTPTMKFISTKKQAASAFSDKSHFFIGKNRHMPVS